jgi:hypothetical protein
MPSWLMWCTRRAVGSSQVRLSPTIEKARRNASFFFMVGDAVSAVASQWRPQGIGGAGRLLTTYADGLILTSVSRT